MDEDDADKADDANDNSDDEEDDSDDDDDNLPEDPTQYDLKLRDSVRPTHPIKSDCKGKGGIGGGKKFTYVSGDGMIR